jgi:peptidoglycan/LPS O-acetylase OafA/YrhL
MVDRPRQLLGLDLIRFSAAFMVLAFHLCAGTALGPLTRWGWVGVEIFFVLSGFVIAYTAAEASAGRFLKSRFIRLMPTVWLCGTVTAIFWALKGGLPDLTSRYFATMTLWPTGPWVDGSYWTLPVEIAFYVLIFVVLCLGAFRRVEWVFAGLSAVSTFYWLGRLALQFWPAAPGLAWVCALPAAWATELLLCHGCYFGIGGVLWLVSRTGWTWARALVGVIGLAGGVIQIAFTVRTASATQPIAEPEAVWLASLVAIWLSVRFAGRLSAALVAHAGAIRLIGLMTFPLYLLHDDLGMALRDDLRSVMPTAPAIAIVAAASVALAAGVAARVEPPIHRWIRRALAGDPGRPRIDDRALRRAAAGDGAVERAGGRVGDEAAITSDGR